MMSPSLFKEAGAASFLNDHTFLLNMALYDRFYFSGLATQVGAFSTGKNYAQLVSDFSKGTSLTDPRWRWITASQYATAVILLLLSRASP